MDIQLLHSKQIFFFREKLVLEVSAQSGDGTKSSSLPRQSILTHLKYALSDFSWEMWFVYLCDIQFHGLVKCLESITEISI